MKHRPVVVAKPWEFGEHRTITIRGRIYNINAALLLAEDLAVEVVPLRYLCTDYYSPCSNRLLNFAEHMKQVMAADLDFPILLNDIGVIIDGRHRAIKALVEGHTTIKVRRFDIDPVACWEYKKESNDE